MTSNKFKQAKIEGKKKVKSGITNAQRNNTIKYNVFFTIELFRCNHDLSKVIYYA